jgi:UDP-MurNAc hydroxylase
MRTPLSFTFIANACGIFTGGQGTRLLCDPWLNDGVFEGSWCHSPPLRTTWADVQDVDAVYVSHLHPDHFDERFWAIPKEVPLVVLDHGPNFLIKKLQALGHHNLLRVQDGQTVQFKELSLTLFAPFAKHNFHDAKVGNLIDSALVVACDGVRAFNANDNTPNLEACTMLRERFGTLDLAMLNYNAAGPYPSCFDNLSRDEKISESRRVLQRNFANARGLLAELPETAVVLLREGHTLDIASGQADQPYTPVDSAAVQQHIASELATLRYPYQDDAAPDAALLVADIARAAEAMKGRMARFEIQSEFSVQLDAAGQRCQIYPHYSAQPPSDGPILRCSMDDRLLRRILDRQAYWNNAEIGAHISFHRAPNRYEPDLHLGLQFFHL